MPPRKKSVDAADASLKLDTLTLLRLRTLDAENSNFQAQHRVVSMEIDTEIAKNPKLKTLLEKRADLVISMSEKKGQLVAIHADIETRFKIRLVECAIDDETGLIHRLVSEKVPDGATGTSKKKQK